MNRLQLRVAHRRDRGAVAIIVGLCMVILLAAAALGMDIARLTYERQALRAAVDAGAQAGSYALKAKSGADAIADALKFTKDSAPDLGLTTTGASPQVRAITFCTVDLKEGTTSTPDSEAVAAACPGSGWVVGGPVLGCNTEMCTVPCVVTGRCNTIRVSAQKRVDFVFGPAINIPYGDTGALSSAACRGGCGGLAPNPLNVVVMADRTFSMSSAAVGNLGSASVPGTGLKGGLGNMLTTMTREQQFVAFGAIHKSRTVDISGVACKTGVASDTHDLYTDNSYDEDGDLKPSATFKGTWVPVGYSSNYTSGATKTHDFKLNAGSKLVKSIDCMMRENNGIGTQLASALKGAAKYVLNDANVTDDVPSTIIADRAALERPIHKLIIFETDGRPDEVLTSPDSDLLLSSNRDIGASGNGEKGCANFKDVANQVKARFGEGDLIVTIGYGDAAYMTCAKDTSYSNPNPYDNVSGSTPVDETLAAVASPVTSPFGPPVASTADKSTCAEENADDDYYFCAATGPELARIFRTISDRLSTNTRLIKVPGVGD